MLKEEINEENGEKNYFIECLEKDENLKSILDTIEQIFAQKENKDNLKLNENIINNHKNYEIPLTFIKKKKINNKSCFLYLIKKYIKSTKNNEKKLLFLIKLFYNNLSFKPKNYHEFYQYLSKILYFKPKIEIEQHILDRILNIIKVIYNLDEEINEKNNIAKNFFYIYQNNSIKINLKNEEIEENDKKNFLFEISFAFKINNIILNENKKISIIKFIGINDENYEISLIDNFIKMNDEDLIELNDIELKNIIQFSIFLSNTKKEDNYIIIINSKYKEIDKNLKFTTNLEIDILFNNFLGKIYFIFGIYDKFNQLDINVLKCIFMKLTETHNDINKFFNFLTEYYTYKESIFLFIPDKIYKNKIKINNNDNNNIIIINNIDDNNNNIEDNNNNIVDNNNIDNFNIIENNEEIYNNNIDNNKNNNKNIDYNKEEINNNIIIDNNNNNIDDNNEEIYNNNINNNKNNNNNIDDNKEEINKNINNNKNNNNINNKNNNIINNNINIKNNNNNKNNVIITDYFNNIQIIYANNINIYVVNNNIDNIGGFIVFIPLINFILSNNKLMNNSNNIIKLLNYINEIQKNFVYSSNYEIFIENLIILYQKYYEIIKLNLKINETFDNICFNKPYIKYLFEIKLLLDNKFYENNEKNKQKFLIIIYTLFCELQKNIEKYNINGICKNLSKILQILNNDEENIDINNITDLKILEILKKNIFLHKNNIFIKYWFYYCFFYYFLIRNYNKNKNENDKNNLNNLNSEQISDDIKNDLDMDFFFLITFINNPNMTEFNSLDEEYQFFLYYLIKNFIDKNEKIDIIEYPNNHKEKLIEKTKKENIKKSFIKFLFIPIPNDKNKIPFNYFFKEYFENNFEQAFMFLINLLNIVFDNELMLKDYILHYIIEIIEKKKEYLNSNEYIILNEDESLNENMNNEYISIKNKIDHFKKYDIIYDEIFSENIIKECLLNNKINQKNYKKLINHLFLNNGYWDYNKNIENNKYKYKILNFITNDFKKPFITKIIDLDYYFPKFSKYDGKETYKNETTLFQHNYNKIYDLNFEDYDFNILNFIELTNEDIINYFIKKYKIDGSKKYLRNCCLIKQLYHIHGFLLFNQKKLIFHSFINNEMFGPQIFCLNYPNKNKCFGQVFCCPKYEENKHLEIPIKDIFYIFLRNYYFKETGIEIITFSGKNYYFNLNSKQYRDDIIKFFSENKKFNKILLKKEKEKDNSNNINNYLAFIQCEEGNNEKNDVIKYISFLKNNYNISNYKLLMLINLFSNRSFLDLYQYPIFPWIIYNEKNENNNKYIIKHRDLNILMAQMKIPNCNYNLRIEMYKESYELMLSELKEKKYKIENIFKSEKINEVKNYIKNEFIEPCHISRAYYFSTHYSNIVYTCGYLIRIFPFSFGCIELQGNYFDIFNRLFHSIHKSFENSCNQKSDIREILPEFFYLPEMFSNKNKLKFNDVNENKFEFPSIKNPYKFFNDFENNNNNIKKDENNQIKNSDCEFDIIKIDNNILYFINYIILFNMFLEKDKNINENLQNWINLVFGSEQKKINKSIMNLFNPESYLDNPLNSKKYLDSKYYKLFLERVEFGVIPRQIFFKKSKEKIINNYENNTLNFINEKSEDKTKQIEKVVYMNQFNNCIEVIFIKNEKLYYYNDKDVKIKLSKFKILSDFKYNNLIIHSYKYDYTFVACDELICIYKKISYKFDKTILENQITSLELIEKNIIFLLCGDKKGNLLIFEINISYLINLNDINHLDDFLTLKKKIYNSFKEINFIKYNDELNLFLVLSKDNYINLYVPYTFKLLKNFQIQTKNYLNFAFLYSFPIPYILTYDSCDKKLIFVTINGEKFNNLKFKGDIILPYYYKHLNSYYLLFLANNRILYLNLDSLEFETDNVINDNNNINYFNLETNNILLLKKDKIFNYKINYINKNKKNMMNRFIIKNIFK